MSTAFQPTGFQSDAFQILAGLAGTPVIVPDVVGQDQESGTTELQTEGFPVVVVEVDSAQAAGTIVSQDPIAGSVALSGATVTISVSRGSGKFYKKFRRKYAVWIGGVKYLGTQEDFQRVVQQAFEAEPERELPQIRVEMPKKDEFAEAARELETQLKATMLIAQKRAYDLQEDEDIVRFLL